MFDEYYAHLDRVEQVYADFSVRVSEINDKIQGPLLYQADCYQIDQLIQETQRKLQTMELDWYLAAPIGARGFGIRFAPVWYVLFPCLDARVKDPYGLPRRGYIAPPDTPHMHSDLRDVFQEESAARDLAASLNLGRLLRQGKLH